MILVVLRYEPKSFDDELILELFDLMSRESTKKIGIIVDRNLPDDPLVVMELRWFLPCYSHCAQTSQ
jgi:hypothetical protein